MPALSNISTGSTGCPVEKLAVFNYDRSKRTWNASCNDQQYLCSARGGISCSKQQTETVMPEVVVRAKALTELPIDKREWYADKDIRTGSWESFSLVVATVQAMSVEQLKEADPRRVFASWSAALDPVLTKCAKPGGVVAIEVGTTGNLFSEPYCSELLASPELDPLKRHPSKSFYLVPGVFGLKPVARPEVGNPASGAAAPAAASVSEPTQQASNGPQSPAASAELDAAVRAWLDQQRGAIAACAGKEQTAIGIRVDAAGNVEASLRGAAGSPEEGCVRSVLSKVPQLPPGAGTILHVVRGGSSD